ncbi:Phox-associated domain-containing protein [Cynara cardunculus var. scolymus]|uniref:Phox-associated domain-containing protein n=1 Tax=Cynara cardunculus var. scolymus TaxID=59895 RepID=A0A124SCB3_CYNCS|nr:Phox-associated domain-containing protein [Cynara cardunculus var. scolymus]
MKAMETLQDLIEEAKLRTVWWALCIFAVSYFLAHTSKSMWMNVPIAILLVSGSRILLNEVEFRWKIRKTRPETYLSHLEKKQLSVNDSRLSTLPPPPKWKRKIDSPVVEAAMEDFINKLLQDFVILLDLVGVHLELFRKNQAAIGVEVMVTLSSEERDERLKHHLMASKELHPAVISPESEYKFLKRIMGAVVAVVLKPREAQSALVRCIARELLACLVMEPVMRFASPAYINELLELIFIANEGGKEADEDQSANSKGHKQDQAVATSSAKRPDLSYSHESDVKLSRHDNEIALPLVKSCNISTGLIQEETKHPAAADWARILEAATQRRTEVLQPENLENMWTKGRNYKKKALKNAAKGVQSSTSAGVGIDGGIKQTKGKEISPKKLETSTSVGIPPKPHLDGQRKDHLFDVDQSNASNFDGGGVEEKSIVGGGSKNIFRKSNSASDLNNQTQIETAYPEVSRSIITEFYSANVGKRDVHNTNAGFDKVLRIEGYVPKLKCRVTTFSFMFVSLLSNIVLGAYFEKLGSKSFAVYSIAVTAAENNTWFVKRRYRNFERLHRQLKDIPNYTLHLPPKRIFSSSTEDAFNYSFGKSSSVMRTLAVNVDDAVDDIVRQFKGVSDGLMRKVAGPSFTYEPVSSATSRSLTWKADELSNSFTRQTTSESANSLSDNEDHDKEETIDHDETDSSAPLNGWHSDSELNSKGFPPRWTPPNVSVPLLNLVDKIFQLNRRGWLRRQVFWISKQILQLMMEDAIDDWLLRQIHWLRRDDIVAHGIRWIQDVLWPEGVFFTRLNAQTQTGSQSDQDSPRTASHPSSSRVNKQGSFEEQLEAARRASDVKKMIFNGAPSTLVSLIGHNQYKRCAKDVYYFLQSDVCLKQLAYGLLELVIITVFPELHDIITDVHDKKQFPPV